MSTDVDIDLFAGAGGWDVGAGVLGLEPVGFEHNPYACLTRAAAGLRTVRADVSQVATAPLAGRLRLLIASPPCQAWSNAGKGAGKVDIPLVWEAMADLERGVDSRAELRTRCQDPNSLLIVEPLRFILGCRPRMVALEQVPPCLEVWRAYRLILRRLGYHVWCGIVNAADFGVPQTRQRAILVASLDRPVGPPAATHCRGGSDGGILGAEAALEPWVSMGEALGLDGIDRPARTVAGHRAPRWAYGLGNSYATGWSLVTEQRSETLRGRVDVARNLDEPAPTMFFGARLNDVSWVRERPATTVLGDPRIGRPGHKGREKGGESHFAVDSVRITIEQASILQSFPAGYPWQGTKTARFSQVGNAIPPLLAAHALAAATGLPFAPAERAA